jgi:hypothetical protein
MADDLFTWAESQDGGQADNLERVSRRIAAAIVEFCRSRVGRQFHADDLRRFVTARCGTLAPGSADRVLRDLRQRAVLDYRVVSRKGSLYEVLGAHGPGPGEV